MIVDSFIRDVYTRISMNYEFKLNINTLEKAQSTSTDKELLFFMR